MTARMVHLTDGEGNLDWNAGPPSTAHPDRRAGVGLAQPGAGLLPPGPAELAVHRVPEFRTGVPIGVVVVLVCRAHRPMGEESGGDVEIAGVVVDHRGDCRMTEGMG